MAPGPGWLSKVPWRGVGEAAGLTAALLFVFLMGFIPHLDTFNDPVAEDRTPLAQLGIAGYEYFVTGEREGYPYTIHVDENVHWVYSAGVQRHDTTFVSYPTGEPTGKEGFFSLRGAVHERGYHVILAQAQELTGVSFFRIFQYLPALWMAFTAFAVYASLRPHPAAIPAAAFVGLIPTTPRFLGPAILVPIGFVLAWIPITLILTEPAKKKAASAALLVGVVGWAFFVHLIGGFAAVGILALAALFGAARQRRALGKLMLLALLPLAWIYRAFEAGVQTEIAREETLPIDFSIFDGFGLLALFGWAIGAVVLSLDPPNRSRTEVMAWTAFGVGALGLIITGVVFDLGRYATYARWHPPFFLAAAVPLAFLVVRAGKWARDGLTQLAARVRPRSQRAARALGATGVALLLLLPVGLSAGAVSQGTGYHVDQAYYHVIEDEDWPQYTWIAANVGPDHEVFLTHPWKAPVLSALSGKEPRTWLSPGNPPVRGEEYASYLQGRAGLEYYILNDVTVVAGPRHPGPEIFEAKGDGVYLMDEDVARQLAEIRAGGG